MIDGISLFIKFKLKSSGKVTFEDDMKAKTIGIDNIGKNGNTFVQNVRLINNFGYNLLNVSQLCDRE